MGWQAGRLHGCTAPHLEQLAQVELNGEHSGVESQHVGVRQQLQPAVSETT